MALIDEPLDIFGIGLLCDQVGRTHRDADNALKLGLNPQILDAKRAPIKDGYEDVTTWGDLPIMSQRSLGGFEFPLGLEAEQEVAADVMFALMLLLWQGPRSTAGREDKLLTAITNAFPINSEALEDKIPKGGYLSYPFPNGMTPREALEEFQGEIVRMSKALVMENWAEIFGGPAASFKEDAYAMALLIGHDDANSSASRLMAFAEGVPPVGGLFEWKYTTSHERRVAKKAGVWLIPKEVYDTWREQAAEHEKHYRSRNVTPLGELEVKLLTVLPNGPKRVSLVETFVTLLKDSQFSARQALSAARALEL